MVLDKVRLCSEMNFGFNAETELYEDLVAAGGVLTQTPSDSARVSVVSDCIPSIALRADPR